MSSPAYNFAIPFGPDCRVARVLEHRGLRRAAFPFDYAYADNLGKLVDITLDRGRGLRAELERRRRLLERGRTARVPLTTGRYKNWTLPGHALHFPHGDLLLSPRDRQTFLRRLDRMMAVLRSGRPTLLVRMSRGRRDGLVSAHADRIKAAFPAVELAAFHPPDQHIAYNGPEWDAFLSQFDFDLAPVPEREVCP